MKRIQRLLCTIRPLARRAFAAGVVALQIGVVSSAIWEASTERRLDAHVEESGTQHLDQHNEDTCGLCAARTFAAMPSAPDHGLDGNATAHTTTIRSQPAPTLARPSTSLSRAPPAVV